MSPMAQSAGIYKSETSPQGRIISGAPFGFGAFVGGAEWGPMEKGQLVFSWPDFQRKFGSYIANSYLAYAVKGHFDNEGGACYVSRTCHYTDVTDASTRTAVKASVTLDDRATTPVPTLEVEALYYGEKGNEISVEIQDNSDDATLFDLIVKVDGEEVERYEGLDMDDSADTFVELMINDESKWIQVTDLDSGTASPDDNPATGSYDLTGGDNGLSGITDADYEGDSNAGNGLYAFDPINALINVAIPGQTTTTIWNSILDYCSSNGYAFGILDPKIGEDPATFKTTVDTAGLNSTYGAIYYPAVGINIDPITGKKKVIPPSGHIAGLYARVANIYGIWETPAGVDEQKGKLKGVDFVEFDSTKNQDVRDVLEPSKINCIVPFDDYGICVYGGYTLDKTGLFPYINERQTFLYCELSIYKGTQWAVWYNNNKSLWRQLRNKIEMFLSNVWRDGGLKGTKESEAFDVQINEALNPAEEQLAGNLNGKIGLATHQPAIFIYFEYYRKVQTGGSS